MPRFLVPALSLLVGCSGATAPALRGEQELTLLHTADTHSALFQFRERIGWADAERGLGIEGSLEDVGGFARLATLVGRERSLSERVLVLDSGDGFQGSLAFDTWSGEPELLALGALGVRAQALGNHELDRGGENLAERYRELATFPLLAANYVPDAASGIGERISPFVVLDATGLRVGVIGVGNVRSVPELRERPNELGVLARNAAGAVQGVVDELRPVVDLVVLLTHLGLEADQSLVRETSGVDVVLGGHQHLALDEPLWQMDCGGSGEGSIRDAWGRSRRCTARRVLIAHSGAYGKYLGKLALTLDDDPARLAPTYDPLDAHEVTSARFELLPAHAGIPEDPGVLALLEAYRPSALERLAFSDVLGFAPATITRVGATGADSPLGNFAANAARWAAGADIAVLGASSLRRDIPKGVLDAETLEASFPFDDPVLRVHLTGSALGALGDSAAREARARDCGTPVFVAGALVRMTCPCENPPCAAVFAGETEICCASDLDCVAVSGACSARSGELGFCLLPVAPERKFSVVTTRYLADGNGRLFDPISSAAREFVGDGLREVVTEALGESEACDWVVDDCSSGCPAALVARARERCDEPGCSAPSEACRRATALCRRLPCLDERAGALRDGRIRIERP